jgi:L-lactate dehydrogenase complex protein LldG
MADGTAGTAGPISGIEAVTDSRAAILGRIRAATTAFEPAAVDRSYRTAQSESTVDQALVDQFVERLVDYKAEAVVVGPDDVANQVRRFLADGQAETAVVPAGFPPTWLPDESGDGRWLSDEPALSVDDLDRIDAVVTGCAIAVAETGTIVLDGGDGQGRRILTLLPDLHVVVVPTSRLVARVPDAVARLDPTRPLTWISGPSATSDIELNRVEGVHGPRRLRVVVVQQ